MESERGENVEIVRDAKGHFMPGVSGNPAGRLRKADELTLISLIDAVVKPEDWQKIIKKAEEQAARGDTAARKWLSDNRFGQPTMRVEADVINEVSVVALPGKVDGDV